MNRISINRENLNCFSGINRCIISSETDSALKLVCLGDRNVRALEFDKISNIFSVKKTWSFFSDKIKIIYESDGHIIFLNSDKKLCISNLTNQSSINIFSENIYDQAIFVLEDENQYKFVAVEKDKIPVIIQLSRTAIINTWEIGKFPILSSFDLRGNYLIFNTKDAYIILDFSVKTMDQPFFIFKFVSQNSSTLEVISSEDGMLKLLQYRFVDSEGEIRLANTADESSLKLASFTENSLLQNIIKFGRFLCFSGKKL